MPARDLLDRPLELTSARQAPTEIRRHESDLGWWEVVARAPHPSLRAHVLGYVGYAELARFTNRLQIPTPGVTLIINLGAPFDIAYPTLRPHAERIGSFVAGVHDAPVLVGANGLQGGLQVDFTPLGASMFFGCAMDELANRSVALDDVLGAAADRFIERLAALNDWDQRFELLDGLIARRLLNAATPSPGLRWAWRELARSSGSASIGALADTLGWTRKQLVAQFRQDIGLPPKTVARVLRFQRAVELLQDGTRSFADIAFEAGYYDQAHFNREFAQFAGQTPRQFLARQLPDGGGYIGD